MTLENPDNWPYDASTEVPPQPENTGADADQQDARIHEPAITAPDGWGEETPTAELDANTANTAPNNDVELPENIGALLTNNLISVPNDGGDTSMFHVDGRPDLRVRLNEGYTVDERRQAKEASDRLTAHDVNVLPSTIVEHSEKAYVVTKEVDGIQLDHALHSETPDELIAQVDSTWAGLCKGYAEAKRTEQPLPGDVIHPYQFMHGTIAGDDTAKVWLVDLPKSSASPNRFDFFAKELLDIANIVVKIEGMTGRSLTAAREAIQEASALCGMSERYGNAMENAVRFVMDHSVYIFPGEDERIMPLRTDRRDR